MASVLAFQTVRCAPIWARRTETGAFIRKPDVCQHDRLSTRSGHGAVEQEHFRLSAAGRIRSACRRGGIHLCHVAPFVLRRVEVASALSSGVVEIVCYKSRLIDLRLGTGKQARKEDARSYRRVFRFSCRADVRCGRCSPCRTRCFSADRIIPREEGTDFTQHCDTRLGLR